MANLQKTKRQYTCQNPNCKYDGFCDATHYGSSAAAAILFLCGLVPGILYLTFGTGWEVHCPKCGMVLRRMSAL